MSAAADALDHVGIAATDLGALAADWEKLGFCLTPLARHSGRRTPDGPVVPFGTGNRCVMLREGYLELIAIVDPGAFSNTLDRFLARYAGIHILALSIEDEDANLARLRRAGIEIPGVAYLERPVDDQIRIPPDRTGEMTIVALCQTIMASGLRGIGRALEALEQTKLDDVFLRTALGRV